MKKIIVFGAFLLGCVLLTPANTQAQVLTAQVKVTGIRSVKGKIIISVFKDSQHYEKEQVYKNFTFDKKAIHDGVLTVDCELEPGTYGLTVLDDENDNGKMDKSMIRIPKEGFGFSNFFMEKMKKPKFDDFKVDLSKQKSAVIVKVKYM